MAETPRDPDRPSGPPKYLPRIIYKPPEPEPEDDDEGEPDPSTSATAGASSPPKEKKGKPSPPSANPPRAGRVESPNPPRGGVSGSSRSSPAGAERPGKPKAGKTKVKGSDIDGGKAKTGTLVEETPEGETFDARRRVRMIVGAVAGCIFLLAMFMIWRTLRPSESEPEPEPPPLATQGDVKSSPKKSPAAQEALARNLLYEARKLEREGKLAEAVTRVDRVIAELSAAPSAKLAKDALERHRQGLPLFVTGAAVVATKAVPKTPEPPAGETPSEPQGPTVSESTVEAAVQPTIAAAIPGAPGAETPAPVRPIPGGDPESRPPEAPVKPVGEFLAEPRRPTGLGFPRADLAARPLPPGFHARAEAGVHPSGWPLEITCDRDGGSMVLIPGGVFTQGRDDGKPEERPAHKVQLSPYYIDQHEVTGRQFALFRPGFSANDLPAVNLSLADARAYALWAAKSIPTEAQWEMAARTSDGRLHPWGNAPADWNRPREPKQIDPVMSFPGDLSPYGVFDLAGNAWEWTNDWFDTKYYGPLKSQTVTNPAGPPKGRGKIPEVVIKGGSKDWDGSWRVGMRPDARLPYLGFRCVLNVEGGPAPATPRVPNQPGQGSIPF